MQDEELQPLTIFGMYAQLVHLIRRACDEGGYTTQDLAKVTKLPQERIEAFFGMRSLDITTERRLSKFLDLPGYAAKQRQAARAQQGEADDPKEE